MSHLGSFDRPPPSIGWHILDIMKKGKGPPFRPGRPPNIWVAMLIDVDPEGHCSGQGLAATRSCCLELGRHRSRDDAWDYAESLLETRH